MSEPFCFTENMREVSGLGGFFESCCRAGVCAGAAWCAAHPGATLRDVAEARELTQAIFDVCVEGENGVPSLLGEQLTLMQVNLIADHVLHIARYGWKDYEQRMARNGANGVHA